MRTIALSLTCLISLQLFPQEWVEKMQDPSVNFYDVQESFNEEWANKSYVKGNGYKQFKRWEWFMEQRVFPTGKRPVGNEAWNACVKAAGL